MGGWKGSLTVGGWRGNLTVGGWRGSLTVGGWRGSLTVGGRWVGVGGVDGGCGCGRVGGVVVWVLWVVC